MKKKYSLVAIVALFVLVPLLTLVAQAADPNFGNLAFKNRWVEQDRLVGSPGVTRPYTWGPSVPEAPNALLEAYNTSPGGQRQVQYFDKARMEINQPANGIITAGLLTKELVSGLRQDGDNTFTQLNSSRTQVAGDAVSVNPNAPTYESFRGVVTLGNPDAQSRPNVVGQQVNAFINKAGQVSTLVSPPEAIMVGAYEANTGHNIARPFHDFKQIRGPITEPVGGTTLQNQPVYTIDPTTNVFGLAISEPYWVSTRIAGVERTVLVQLFERRVLTYNPAITGASKVEMGNLGQHYYQWRYVEAQQAPPQTTQVPSTTIPIATPPPTSGGGQPIPSDICLLSVPPLSGNLVQACVTNTTPVKNSIVKVYGILTVNGLPAGGATMDTVWNYKTTTSTCSGTAGSAGLANCTLNIGGESSGFEVVINVKFSYNGQVYTTSTSFTPQ